MFFCSDAKGGMRTVVAAFVPKSSYKGGGMPSPGFLGKRLLDELREGMRKRRDGFCRNHRDSEMLTFCRRRGMITIFPAPSMASSTDNDNPSQPPDARDRNRAADAKDNPPLNSGWAELWKTYARLYGPYSFGMLIVISIMVGMSAVGWLIWWLAGR